jgi:hypothetical protein
MAHAYRGVWAGKMARIYSARQAGEALDLPHLEVIRRIRRGDIKAKKLGWNWVVEEEALNQARESDWYKRHLERKTATAD